MKLIDYAVPLARFYNYATIRGNSEQARDIVHTAYLNLLSRNRDYNDANHVHSVLVLEVRAQCIKHYMASKKFVPCSVANTVATDDLERDAGAYLQAKKLYKSLQGKPSMQRVFEAALDLGGVFDTKTVANELNMSHNSFKVTLHNLRKLLKADFA